MTEPQAGFATDTGRGTVSTRSMVAALAWGVVLAAVLRGWLVVHRGAALVDKPLARVVMDGSLVLQVVVTIVFVGAALVAARNVEVPSRGVQRLLGALATATLVTSLLVVLASIYRRNGGSYELLVESFGLYLAINFVFLYWYWYADHPLRVEAGVDESIRIGDGIRFPEDDLAADAEPPRAWTPGMTDYVYFTVLSSNCFGAPEGHVLIGRTMKLIQIVHTAMMIFVFIVVLSRAVNTLG